MKIIVPTDFSELARVAVRYAAQYASATGNPLVLVNNVMLEGMPRAGVLVNLDEKMESIAMEDLRSLANEVRSETSPSPDMFFEISKSSRAAEAILQAAESNDAGLIIMGSRGSSGLAGTFLGSVSSEVIRKSKLPVIIVPENATFSKNGKALFALNPDSPSSDASILKFQSICSALGHTPEFFSAGLSGTDPGTEQMKQHLQSATKQTEVIFHTHSAKDPEEAISEFMQSKNYALLAVDPRHHSFLERLTGKSVTTRLIANATVPVLTLP